MGMHKCFNDDYSGPVGTPTEEEKVELCDVLLDALRFYSEPKNWKETSTDFADPYLNIVTQAAVLRDEGFIARQAILKTKGIADQTAIGRMHLQSAETIIAKAEDIKCKNGQLKQA